MMTFVGFWCQWCWMVVVVCGGFMACMCACEITCSLCFCTVPNNKVLCVVSACRASFGLLTRGRAQCGALQEFEHSCHVMLNLKPPESSSVCDAFAERGKRPRDDSDPWNVAWSSDTHRRLEVLGDNKVVINWMNGVWEVKGDEHVVPVRGVVDQFVQWYLDGTSFRPRTYETDYEKLHKTRHSVLSFDGARRGDGLGAVAWIRCLRHEYGSFEKSLLRWTCAEERVSDVSWTGGSANGHWTLDCFVSDRS